MARRRALAAVTGRAAPSGVALLLSVLVGACATPPEAPPVRNTRLVDADRVAVLEAASGFLERRGIAPVTTDPEAGMLDAGPASFAGGDWADCPDVRVRDQDGERRRDAEQVGRTVAVRIETGRQGGRTLVEVVPRFVQTLENSFTNSTFEGPCATTGRLERAVLDSL